MRRLTKEMPMLCGRNCATIRKLVEQGKKCSVTAIAYKLIIVSHGDEGMCVNTYQATGKIPAKTTAGDIAKGNYINCQKK